MSLNECQLILLKPEDASDGIAYCPNNSKTSILIGQNPQCDIRINKEDIKSVHFKIYVDAAKKIKIVNLCKEKCILVNDEIVEGKKYLKSGDIINCVGNQMRWESKLEAKRLTLLMSRSERKAKASSRLLKTTKRITVHKINSLNIKTQPELLDEKEVTKPELQDEAEVSQSIPEKQQDPVTSSSPPAVPNKENEISPKSALNLSGVLQTSYIPEVSSVKRNSSRIARTPRKMNISSSSSKNVLSESLANLTSTESPNQSPRQLNKSSMHLIDLTTPARVSSKTTSTPLTSKRTLKIDLLKSAIKNSTHKKIVETKSTATPKKTLTFNETENSNVKESPIANDSSTIEVSTVIDAKITEPSETTSESLDGNVNESNGGSYKDALKTTNSGQSNAEDKKFGEIIENMESFSESKDVGIETSQNGSSQRDETSVEEKFKRMFDDVSGKSDEQQPSPRDLSNNDDGEYNSLSAEKQFDKMMGKPSISRTYSPAVKTPRVEDDQDQELTLEKGKDFLKWIDNVRDSIPYKSNPTQQVLSERYSDVTPNESIVEKLQQPIETAEAYDVKTPKLSILEAVSQLNKTIPENQKLTMSPVTRLSVSNGTAMLENYQLIKPNSEMPQSLRSSRKKFGRAMASLNNPDESIDPDETLNITNDNNAVELNQSKSEDVNYLSLDQPNHFEDEEPMFSNNFIEFEKETDDYEGSIQEVFELNSTNGSEKSKDEEEYEVDEDENISESDDCSDAQYSDEEIVTIDDSIAGTAQPHFRIDEEDLEEGVQPLNISLNNEVDDAAQAIIKVEVTESPRNNYSETIPTTSKTEESLLQESGSTVNDEESTYTIQIVESSQEEEKPITAEENIEIPATQADDIDSLLGSVESSQQGSSIIDEQLEEELLNPKESPSRESLHSSQEQTKEEAEKMVVEDEVTDQLLEKTEEHIVESTPVETVETKAFDTSAVHSNLSSEKLQVEDQDEDDIEIPATQAFETEEQEEEINESDFEVSASQDIGDSSQTENPKETLDETSYSEAESIAYEAITEAEISLLTPTKANESESKKTMESSIFSDTEFSRVEIRESFMSDSNDSPNIKEELKGLENEPGQSSSKRGVTMLPEQITQSSKSRVTLAPSEVVQEDDLSNSFKQYVELQQELVNVQDKLNLGPRARSLTPERDNKLAESRLTMAPPLSELSESFEQSLEIQKELVNVHDQPDKRDLRVRSVTPSREKRTVESRKTNVHSTEELSESFEQYVELQKELTNVDGHPNSKHRAKSVSPERDEKIPSAESRKTLVPATAELSDSFVEVIKNVKEKAADIIIEEAQEETNDSKAESMQKEDAVVEPSKDIDSSIKSEKAIVEPEVVIEEKCVKKEANVTTPSRKAAKEFQETPSRRRAARVNYSDLASGTFKAETQVKTLDPEADAMKMEEHVEPKEDNKFASDSSEKIIDEPDTQQEVVEEICVKKKAYVTTPAKNMAEEPLQTPSTRRAARVNYSNLASGATPGKEETPRSLATPRRGRSASTDAVAENINEIKVKSTRKAKPPVATIVEEAEVSANKVSEVPKVDPKQEQRKTIKETPKDEEALVETEPSQETEVGMRRRVQRVNYVQLATGTPNKTAPQTEPVKTKRVRKIELKTTTLVDEKPKQEELTVLKTENVQLIIPSNPVDSKEATEIVSTEDSSSDKNSPTVSSTVADQVQELEEKKLQKKQAKPKITEIISTPIAPRSRGRLQKALSPTPNETSTLEQPKRGRRQLQSASLTQPEVTSTSASSSKSERRKPEALTTETPKTTKTKPENVVEESTTSRRGNKKIAELSSQTKESSVTPRRGRAASKAPETNLQTVDSVRSLRSQSRQKSPPAIVTKPTPKTRGISKTKSQLQTSAEHDSVPVEIEIKEPAKKLTRKRKASESTNSSQIEPEKSSASTKPRRGKKGKDESDEKDEPTVAETAESESESQQTRRGKSKKEEDPNKAESSAKSRKGNVEKIESTQSLNQPDAPEHKKPRRGKAVKEIETAQAVESVERENIVEVPKSRRGAKKVAEEVAPAPEVEASKPRRVNKKQEEEDNLIEKPAKATRGRAKATKEDVEIVEEPEPVVKKARGRQAKVEVITEVVPVEVPTKRGRGKAANVDSSSQEVVEVDAEPPMKRAARAKKVAFDTPGVEVKNARGKREQTKAVDEPVAKRSTRARK